MARAPSLPIIAVDVGNSRVKLGEFALPLAEPLPQPARTITLERDFADEEIDRWLQASAADFAWTIASVNRPVSNRLTEWLAERRVRHVRQLTYADLPLAVDVLYPERVGIDRLVAALAANRLRAADEPAIVITHGTAITVNLIDARGTFAGGAILPGIDLASRALHEFTDGLPQVAVIEAPSSLVRSTEGAIQFGLFWGTVGAVREVVARLTPGADDVAIYLTGGGAPAIAAALGEGRRRPPEFVPRLTLAGVALAAAHLAPRNEP